MTKTGFTWLIIVCVGYQFITLTSDLPNNFFNVFQEIFSGFLALLLLIIQISYLLRQQIAYGGEFRRRWNESRLLSVIVLGVEIICVLSLFRFSLVILTWILPNARVIFELTYIWIGGSAGVILFAVIGAIISFSLKAINSRKVG